MRRLILAAAYVASVLLPAAHHLAAARGEHCETCPAVAPEKVLLDRPCNGPCGDPTHHHHPRHDERQCPTCQSGTMLLGHLLAAPHFSIVTPERAFLPQGGARPFLPARLRTISARAPPAGA